LSAIGTEVICTGRNTVQEALLHGLTLLSIKGIALAGKAAHKTDVTDVSPPYGGYPKFIERGFNDDYFPVWMQEAGYNTHYTGMMMNGHSTKTYDNPA